MTKSILERLFDGELNPAESIGLDNSELLEIYEQLAIKKPKLLEKLPDSIREDMECVDELVDQAKYIYSKECFSYGFKLGITLLVDALSDKESLLHKESE